MEKCWICGKEMINTVGGCYHCPTCGVGVNDGVFRTPSNCDMPLPQGFGKQEGWICPVCGRGVAPWVNYCPCMQNQKITYDTKVGVGDVTYGLAHLETKQPTANDLDLKYNVLSGV